MISKDKSTTNILVRKWQEQSHKDKLYWMKALFGTIAALISTIIRPVMFSPMLDSPFMGTQHPALIAAVTGVILMIGLSTLVGYLLLKITPDLIGGKMAYFTTGLFTGLFLWFVIWTVLYNIIVSLSPPITVMQIIMYMLTQI